MTDDLFGRESELGQFDVILQRRQPALVLVTGQSGMGKSSLLKKFQSLAAAVGWKTVPTTAEQELSIDTGTTENSFSDLMHRLSSTPDESFVRTASAQAHASAADWDRSAEPVSTQSFLHPSVEQLRSWAPVLLLIDTYRPDSEFASWFTDSFIRDIKRADASIVVVVAARPDYVAKVSPVADEVITLSPLDRSIVRQHFQAIGEHISPPMESAELDRYVEVIYSQPEMFNSLTRVLWLAQRRDASYRLRPTGSTM